MLGRAANTPIQWAMRGRAGDAKISQPFTPVLLAERYTCGDRRWSGSAIVVCDASANE
jgi:hypothetical protein